MILKVRITPKASRNQIVGWEKEILKIRIAAPPEKGRANRALERYLAEILKIAPSRVQVVGGETSRNKSLQIEGVSKEELHGCLISEVGMLDSNFID
jgi:uncharacterized protein (TIGR00251 family)